MKKCRRLMPSRKTSAAKAPSTPATAAQHNVSCHGDGRNFSKIHSRHRSRRSTGS
jgi:hypothetical protein